jgi:hypothetical protein
MSVFLSYARWKCVPGIDWDTKARKKGIFRFSEPVHQGWNPRVDKELGNYDYLLGKHKYLTTFPKLIYFIGADVGICTAPVVELLTTTASD